MEKLQQYKKEVDAFLTKFLVSKEKDFARVNAWGPDALSKIRAIVSEGKTIRGALVLLVHDLLKGEHKNEALCVAAAYELIQTGLITHDDIMDHDTVRRGKPTMHVQYKNEGMAMCVGDILFFLAWELLDETPVGKISALIFQEVGLAQMQDLSFNLKNDTPSKKEILALYQYKTARYTFSLPMMAGAQLAGASNKTISLFESLGQSMGILFQIQNDAKGVAGDLRENKKTLARFYDIQPELNKYKINAERVLDNLQKQMDVRELSTLLTFVITRKR